MKNIFFALLLLSSNLTFSQVGQLTPALKNLFDPNYRQITFLGIDFSKCKLIGDFTEALGVGETGSGQTKNAYFKAWNNLVSGEREKYNIKAIVKNQNIVADIENVMKLNNAKPVDELTGYKQPDYTAEEIKKHVQQYNTASNKGLGVALLIECFDKNNNQAVIDFVVVDLSTKETILLKKITTTPQGLGLRNYWAGSIYEAFKYIERSFIKEWKKEYNWNQ